MKRNFNLQKMHILCAEAIKLRKARLCYCCAETAIYHLQAMQKKKKKKEFTQNRMRVWGKFTNKVATPLSDLPH